MKALISALSGKAAFASRLASREAGAQACAKLLPKILLQRSPGFRAE
ncbi:MAG TPA: hypothetical protein VFQ61_01125 [Polyangiaceae bacterium]|nr:hypothetical protein [Polyangiaceae bacterium]